MNVHNGPMPQPWESKLQVLSRSMSRCIVRAGATRYVIIRVPEHNQVFRVKVYKARRGRDSETVVEDFCPVFEQDGDFDAALAAFAERVS